jgi:hypothetical protein
LDFPFTGAWSIWKKEVIEVNLQAGENVLKVTALGADGMVNLDLIQIANFGTGIADPVISVNGFRAYPNPAMDFITFEVGLHASTNVSIDILDLNGKRISQVENGMLPAGVNTVTWNAGDLVPGLYVGRIKASGIPASKSILISIQ